MFIRFVTFNVADQDRALAFYTSLGFATTMDRRFGAGYRWLTVAPPAAETGITLHHDPERAGNGNLVLAVEDIHKLHAWWEANGVAFREPPTTQPWGVVQALIEDPDGNTLVIVEVKRP